MSTSTTSLFIRKITTNMSNIFDKFFNIWRIINYIQDFRNVHFLRIRLSISDILSTETVCDQIHSLFKFLWIFPTSKNSRELANYYRKYITNFSHIALPLTDTTRNNAQGNLRSIEWTESMQTVKKTLTSASCLALPDSYGEFEVITNASEDAKTVGAILTHNDHSVIYESTKLNSH